MAREAAPSMQIGVAADGGLPLPWLGAALDAAAALAGAHALRALAHRFGKGFLADLGDALGVGLARDARACGVALVVGIAGARAALFALGRRGAGAASHDSDGQNSAQARTGVLQIVHGDLPFGNNGGGGGRHGSARCCALL